MSKPQKNTGRAPRKKTSVGNESGDLPARWVEGLLLAGLMAFTLIIFAESLSADFTFDDTDKVVNNPDNRQGHLWDLVDFGDEYYGWRRALTNINL